MCLGNGGRGIGCTSSRAGWQSPGKWHVRLYDSKHGEDWVLIKKWIHIYIYIHSIYTCIHVLKSLQPKSWMAKRMGIWMKHNEIGSTWMSVFQCWVKQRNLGTSQSFVRSGPATALLLTQGQRLAAIAVHGRPGPIRGTSWHGRTIGFEPQVGKQFLYGYMST